MDIRYTMMDILDDTTDNVLYDPTTLDVSSFNFSNGYYKHVLSQKEKEKPYMLSYAYYGTIAFEHLILLINGIKDIWEIPVGTKIKIPKLGDLKTWIKENRK